MTSLGPKPAIGASKVLVASREEAEIAREADGVACGDFADGRLPAVGYLNLAGAGDGWAGGNDDAVVGYAPVNDGVEAQTYRPAVCYISCQHILIRDSVIIDYRLRFVSRTITTDYYVVI